MIALTNSRPTTSSIPAVPVTLVRVAKAPTSAVPGQGSTARRSPHVSLPVKAQSPSDSRRGSDNRPGATSLGGRQTEAEVRGLRMTAVQALSSARPGGLLMSPIRLSNVRMIRQPLVAVPSAMTRPAAVMTERQCRVGRQQTCSDQRLGDHAHRLLRVVGAVPAPRTTPTPPAPPGTGPTTPDRHMRQANRRPRLRPARQDRPRSARAPTAPGSWPPCSTRFRTPASTTAAGRRAPVAIEVAMALAVS